MSFPRRNVKYTIYNIWQRLKYYDTVHSVNFPCQKSWRSYIFYMFIHEHVIWLSQHNFIFSLVIKLSKECTCDIVTTCYVFYSRCVMSLIKCIQAPIALNVLFASKESFLLYLLNYWKDGTKKYQRNSECFFSNLIALSSTIIGCFYVDFMDCWMYKIMFLVLWFQVLVISFDIKIHIIVY